MDRPLILVTSDDGVRSSGLRAAAEAVRELGDVLIVAPLGTQTGMGRAFPRTGDEGVIHCHLWPFGEGLLPYYGVKGSPAQAVAHAVLEIAPRRSAVCICGINDGENLGGTNLISGTVGAALEAASFGMPVLAVSRGPEEPDLFCRPYLAADWLVAASLLRRFTAAVIQDGLPPGVALLNINIPSAATLATEIRVTSQSRQNHYSCRPPEPRDRSKPFRLPVEAAVDVTSLEPDSDLFAYLVDGVVSVTPMSSDLTVRNRDGSVLKALFRRPDNPLRPPLEVP